MNSFNYQFGIFYRHYYSLASIVASVVQLDTVLAQSTCLAVEAVVGRLRGMVEWTPGMVE